jgi:hypothetical protein
LEIVAAVYDRRRLKDSGAHRAPLQSYRGESAVDIIFQMSNGCLLA